MLEELEEHKRIENSYSSTKLTFFLKSNYFGMEYLYYIKNLGIPKLCCPE